MASGFETDPNVCANVYPSWKSARNALSQSIQAYLNACDALTLVSLNALTQSITTWGGSVPDALSAIDAELSELVHEEERLQKARLSLLESRNRTKAFSKISTLPTEILSLIFLAAKPSPMVGGVSVPTHYPTAIASVCQRWQKIALALPSMWSHLYYAIDGPEQANTRKCVDLWNERARDAPRYVEMYQMDTRVRLEEPIPELPLSLGAQASHVECLYLECSQLSIQAVLHILIKRGTPGSMKVLQLHEEDERDNSGHILFWHSLLWFSAPSSDRISEFLSSVRFLELWNTYFPWDSTAYHNLFELSLDLSMRRFYDSGCTPTQIEMKQILSSSPMLHTLSLKLAFSLRERQPSVEPIRLNNLQTLTLKSDGSSGCLGLLPLIEPGRNGLSVTVSIHSDSAFGQEICSFFQRSRITTLHVAPIQANLWFKLLSTNSSHLKSLTLNNCDFQDGELADFFNASSASNSLASPWPEPRTLELVNCRINGDILGHLIPIKSIRRIRLYGGSTVPPGFRAKRAADPKAISMQELERRLSSIVPDTEYLPYDESSWL